jgi:purine-nucleoside phosphorylase
MTKQRIEEAYNFLISNTSDSPELLIILGSGLGDYAESLEDINKISYLDVPGFPKPTVVGHEGNLVFGKKHGKNIVVMQGRFHCYEGYSPAETVIPIRTMIKLGIKSMMITNAAGGVNESFNPGDLMVITDHINLAGFNPLIGKNDDEMGPRFCDMSYAYNKDLGKILFEGAEKLKIKLQQGVYCLWTGPSFETPAEIVMSRVIGADAVGMSTVPEVIAANHAGIRCAGISCITNMAAGMLDQPLNHEEVLETGKRVSEKTKLLIDYFVSKI